MSGVLSRVLVTGATGLLGNNVVRAAVGRVGQVRALVRLGSSIESLAGLPVEIVRGDVCNVDDIRRAMVGVSHVVHAAADVTIGWRMTDAIRRVNIDGAAHVAQVAREVGARLVHVSTVNALALGVARTPANEETPFSGWEVPCNYVASKREGTSRVARERDLGLSVSIVYPGFMLGPWDWKPSSGKMFQAVAAGHATIAPRGGCSLCDVRDVADAIFTLLGRAGVTRDYVLAGHNWTYWELWTSMANVAGRRRPWLRLGPLAGYIAGRVGDLWGKGIGTEPLLNSAMIAMGNRCHYYDSSRAVAELGYRIRPSEEILRDAWAWLRDRQKWSTGTGSESV